MVVVLVLVVENVLTGMVEMVELLIHKKVLVDVVVLMHNMQVVELVKVVEVQVMQMLVMVKYVVLQQVQVD